MKIAFNLFLALLAAASSGSLAYGLWLWGWDHGFAEGSRGFHRGYIKTK